MPVAFTCPHCGLETLVADEYTGRSGPCSRCGKPITVPPVHSPSSYAPPAPRKTPAWVILLVILVAGGMLVLTCAGLTLSWWRVSSVRAQRYQCTNNLKRIGLALHNYYEDYQCFPPAYVADTKGQPMHSWRVLLLPYLDKKEQDLYRQYRLEEPWSSPHNLELSGKIPDVYRCPDAKLLDEDSSVTDYMMIVGPGMLSDGPGCTQFSDIKDGLDDTIMVIETAASSIMWTQPQDLDAKSISFSLDNDGRSGIGSNHNEGPKAVFADGSVRVIPCETKPGQVKAMATIAGGEVVDPF